MCAMLDYVGHVSLISGMLNVMLMSGLPGLVKRRRRKGEGEGRNLNCGNLGDCSLPIYCRTSTNKNMAGKLINNKLSF